jgi:hypothetical protein
MIWHCPNIHDWFTTISQLGTHTTGLNILHNSHFAKGFEERNTITGNTMEQLIWRLGLRIGYQKVLEFNSSMSSLRPKTMTQWVGTFAAFNIKRTIPYKVAKARSTAPLYWGDPTLIYSNVIPKP